jgi:hypothetical protein
MSSEADGTAPYDTPEEAVARDPRVTRRSRARPRGGLVADWRPTPNLEYDDTLLEENLRTIVDNTGTGVGLLDSRSGILLKTLKEQP